MTESRPRMKLFDCPASIRSDEKLEMRSMLDDAPDMLIHHLTERMQMKHMEFGMLSIRSRLRAKGVIFVGVPYHGYSDNGEMEMDRAEFQGVQPDPIPQSAQEKRSQECLKEFGYDLDQIFCELLNQHREGWEIDMGTQGEISWHLNENTVTLSGCTPDPYDMDDDEDNPSHGEEALEYEPDPFEFTVQLGEDLPEVKIPRHFADPWLERFEGLRRDQLTEASLDILRELDNFHAGMACCFPDPEAAENAQQVRYQINPLVPISWNAPNKEVHAIWNLFCPELGDFWTRDKQAAAVNYPYHGQPQTASDIEPTGNISLCHLCRARNTRD